MDMTIEYPLYALLLLLPLALWVGWQLKMRVQQRIQQALGGLLAARGDLHKKRERWSMLLLLAALVMLVVALAGPVSGMRQTKVLTQQLDIVLILDISRSMQVRDVLPNRLERAKSFAETLVQTINSEQVGLVLMAGNGYPHLPLTRDMAAVQTAIRSASPELAPTQGTAIGQAMAMAVKRFSTQRQAARVVILISDGETHDADAAAQVRAAARQGIMLFGVGVGTLSGGHIPVLIADREDIQRNERGEPVKSRLEEERLKELAKLGGGRYFRLSANGETRLAGQIRDAMASLVKTKRFSKGYEVRGRYFQYALALALVLLAGSMILQRDETSA